MLPAFPMDGGRVLRATLALVLPYQSATRIAVGIGQFVALSLGLAGLLTGNLMLVLLAGFVFLAARGEFMLADEGRASHEAKSGATLLDTAGNKIADIPARSLPVVSAQWAARNVLGWLSSDSVDEFLVSSHGVAVAIVRKCDLMRAVSSGLGTLPIEQLIAGHSLPFRQVPSGLAG